MKHTRQIKAGLVRSSDPYEFFKKAAFVLFFIKASVIFILYWIGVIIV